MRVALPHDLGAGEAARRIRAHLPELDEMLSGGLVRITTRWADDQRLELEGRAMGKTLNGAIEIGDSEVVVRLDLPPALAFTAPMIENTIHAKAGRLLG